MGRIVIEIMPEPEILDPQGKAVVGNFPCLDLEQFTGMRQGYCFELTADGPITEEYLVAAREAVDTLLSNPVIEDIVSVTTDKEAWAMSESLSSSPTAHIGVITSPRMFDNTDAVRVMYPAGAESVNLWHKNADLCGVDAVVASGGFSYGDYLRCSTITRFTPVMKEIVAATGCNMSALDVCNDFQILAETHLLLNVLLRNANQRLICVEQRPRVEDAQTTWTSRYVDGDEIVAPMKNGEDNFIISPGEFGRLEREGLVVFRYMGNPNGSACDITDMRNKRGNVVEFMPHPEHAVESGFGSGSQVSPYIGADGLRAFRSATNPLPTV